MAVYLSPVGNGTQWFNSAGQVLSGGKINTYTAGTTTNAPTYTTSSGAVPNANPIILNSAGISANEIWFAAGVAYKLIISDSAGNTLQVLDNLQGMNDPAFVGGGAAATTEWTAGPTPTYVSATTFTVGGNQTAVFVPQRRIQATVTAGVIYGSVASSSFGAGVTTVVCLWDSTALDSGLSAVNYGFISSTANSSLPNINPLPPGSLQPFAGSSAPTGWLLCYGQAVSRTLYAVLFGIISTTYGTGDGSTTFNLPDLRGRSLFGLDNMGGAAASRVTAGVSGITGTTLGAAGGDQSITSHTHGPGSLSVSAGQGSHTHTSNAVQSPAGIFGGSGATTWSAATINAATLPGLNVDTGATAATGAGASQNMPPTMMVNWLIKT
jgi:microcystin-dependent protein